MWFGTRNGLNRYNGYVFDRFLYDQDDSLSISDNYIKNIGEDSDGNLWIGTYSDGIYYTNAYLDRFRHYDPELSGIASGPIGPITEYGGRIWMGTEVGGLLSFDPQSGSISTHPCPGSKDGDMAGNNVKSLLVSGDTLFVGLYSGGLYTFDPELMEYTGHYGDKQTKAVYSMCKGPSGDILLGTFSSHALQHFDSREKTVKYLEYPEDRKIEFKQITSMLSIHDTLYVGTSDRISYAKLPPGKYVFRVRGSNNDNVWNMEGASLAIRVRPPFYRSAYAVLFYMIFLSIVAYILFSYYAARQKLRQQAFRKE